MIHPGGKKDARGTVDELSYHVIGAAIDVHRALGPGLLESAYEACLFRELQHRGVSASARFHCR
jgi:GxxExxY protein